MMDAFVTRTRKSNNTGSPTTEESKDSAAVVSPRKKGREQPPAKRVRREEVADSDEDHDILLLDTGYHRRHASLKDEGAAALELDQQHAEPDDHPPRPTAIESSLPDVKADSEALQEYEAYKASQTQEADDDDSEKAVFADNAASRLETRKWVRGKSSIYVDAFNLALSTVLDEESHLFDAKEHSVFHQWIQLGYEAQFLYVRLFLRKTAQWYRVPRLGYHGDIGDAEAAVYALQEHRELQASECDTRPAAASVDADVSCFITEQYALGESFVFADKSEDFIDTVEEAITLLSLDEVKALAKEAKVQGKNKADIAKAICRTSRKQTGLLSLGLRRSDTSESTGSGDPGTPDTGSPTPGTGDDSNRNKHFLDKILAMTGPCIRLSIPIFKLFERVHLVFYRSTEWTEKSLTAIILAKISKRNFPEYIVSRSANIFATRAQLLEFETAMRTEYDVDSVLEFNGPATEAGFRKVLAIFELIYPRWRTLLEEEQRKEDRVYESGEGAYLRRLNPAHSYTRIVHKAAHVMGRLKEHRREHALLLELLDQRLFHLARRGAWYQRRALLEEHYMHALEPDPASTNVDIQKKHWKRIAITTCEAALEDRDCHLIYHYDIQKRLVKLERQLKVPKRLQHDFGHVRLEKPEEHRAEGIQIKRDDVAGKRGRGPSTKTVWVDEAEGGGECSVEAMCLSWYRGRGWKGFHAEGGIVRTLFAYLFFDVLFAYAPNVFQTAYQTCPLDLHTDAFYATRASEINHRLVEIANGAGPGLVAAVDARERPRRTAVIGLNWDYEVADLLELVACFDGPALAAVCKVLAQEYGQRGGGVPDLLLWRNPPAAGELGDGEAGDEENGDEGRADKGGERREGADGEPVGEGEEEDKKKKKRNNEKLGAPQREGSAADGSVRGRGSCMFVEVKSANDRLSDTQRLWIHVLTGAGVRVALCNAVAREVREA